MLKLYNTLTRKKEIFKPLHKEEVRIYSCGPTVYSYQHIGNLRSYIFSDILKRVLLYNGFNVKHVMNVTDVGHLTSDADVGEDKIEKAAKKEGKRAEDIADFYWKIFRQDFKRLNIIEPTIWCKATEHIKEMVNMIKRIEEKGYTYRTSDGIYFDTSKLKEYGKLARLKKEGLKAGVRVDIKEKKHPTDFALWKFSKEPGKRQQEWEAFGKMGFPGWHIECSAMGLKYLGGKEGKFDIHTGGEDHIAIHHPNEMAQNYAYLGHDAVNFWIHGAFLTFKGEKVSKSTGGLYTISELEEKGYSPLDYRYLCLTTKYNKQLNFSLENLDNAKNSFSRLKEVISSLKGEKKINKKYLQKFEEAINDDLDMPKALAVLWKFIRDKKAEGKLQTIKRMDQVLGLDLLKKEKGRIPNEVLTLVAKREQARKKGNWKEADSIRQQLKHKGFWVDDTPQGPKIKFIKG